MYLFSACLWVFFWPLVSLQQTKCIMNEGASYAISRSQHNCRMSTSVMYGNVGGYNSWCDIYYILVSCELWPLLAVITSSNENIFRVTVPLCGEVTGHWWIIFTKASDAEFWCFFDLRLNKRWSKQSLCRMFETSSLSLWRHCNALRRNVNLVKKNSKKTRKKVIYI